MNERKPMGQFLDDNRFRAKVKAEGLRDEVDALRRNEPPVAELHDAEREYGEWRDLLIEYTS